MPTQVQFVRKWGVSKGIISRYHNQGMPLTSFAAAEQWVAENVPFGKVHCAAEEARLGPIRLPPEMSGAEDEFDETPDPREGNPNWRMTEKELKQAMEILLYMKREGANRPRHPSHQSFCTGIRMVMEHGLDFTPAQWSRARGEEKSRRKAKPKREKVPAKG